MKKFIQHVRLARELVMLGIAITKLVIVLADLVSKAVNWIGRCYSITNTNGTKGARLSSPPMKIATGERSSSFVSLKLE
nr:hypothetical protein XF11B_53480 [Bradyrhizobium diazoefficiens]BCF09856.1 hypothetical protein XF12B_52290 [Bradyrhizobium diazoefficiens]